MENVILKLNRTFKVLYLSGPRQVGKTTLLKHLSKKYKINYVSLDDLALRELAQADPGLFLQRYAPPLFIDEVQYAPQLFPHIKINVDSSNKNGQYWLTGSQQFSIMRNVKESLAGRVGIVNLLGFSLAEDLESRRCREPFLPGRPPIKNKTMKVKKLFEIILRGSFPVLTHKDAPTLTAFYNSYLQTYIDRDLRDIFKISKISDFHRFLALCAARTGQILNFSELAKDADISVHAAREWINILEASFQIYLLRPYFGNFSKRLIKTPKLYFLDTGLAAYLTRWKTPETLLSGAMAPAFFETFVISEIIKSHWHRGEDAPLYYFRDKEGHEVDLLIDHENQIHPIEIKMSSRVQSRDARNINYLRRKIKNFSQGAIVSLGPNHLPLDREDEIIPAFTIS